LALTNDSDTWQHVDTMLTKTELLKKGNIGERRLKVYRDLGLISAPRRQARSDGRGSVTLYDEEAVARIQEIDSLQKQEGLTLMQARDRLLGEQRSHALADLLLRIAIEFRRRNKRLMTKREGARLHYHVTAALRWTTPGEIWKRIQREADLLGRLTEPTVRERAEAIDAAFRGARVKIPTPPPATRLTSPTRARTKSALRNPRRSKTGHQPREDGTAGGEGDDGPALNISTATQAPTSV